MPPDSPHLSTSPDIAGRLEQGNLVAVLPIGAFEQHGAHLPLTTDTLLADGVAHRLAAALDAWLLAPVAYGDAWNNEGFAGTLSISSDTLRAIIVDLGQGLRRMGVAGLVVVNGHFGNREPIALAARALAAAGLPVLHLDYPGLDRIADELADTAPAGPGFFHADEIETSMLLALSPDLVRMDLAVASYPSFPPTYGMEPIKLDSFNPAGVFGDPRTATAAKGEAIINRIVSNSLDLVAEWRARHGI